MKEQYFVTVRGIALQNFEFYKATDGLDARALVECIPVAPDEESDLDDDEILLKVPSMCGLTKEIFVIMRLYNKEKFHSLDGTAFESVRDFREAFLIYAKNRLVTQMDLAIMGVEYDGETNCQSNFDERLELFMDAADKFKDAYKASFEFHKKHRKPNSKEN